MSPASRPGMCRVIIPRGTLRGRRVNFTEQEGLRPTPSRVREAVFGMLVPYAEEGFGFLDACAGSGVMGFTAASCGFEPVIMVESNRAALSELEANKRTLETEADLVYGSALQTRKLPLSSGQWVCYADPPFNDRKFHGKMMKRLGELEAFTPGSIYVAEHENPLETPEGYRLIKEKKYGRARITLFEKEEAST